MTTDALYEVLRLILGDRQVHTLWNYDDATLRSGLRAVFLLGRGPDGYKLAVGSSTDTITPDFTDGDPYALTCYEAALLLIGGEDGAIRLQTRDVTLADSGERKRDLLDELHQLIYEVRDGPAVFSTYQSLLAFLHLVETPQSYGGYSVLVNGSEARLKQVVPDLAI